MILAVSGLWFTEAKADYESMIFNTADGEAHIIGVTGLKINASGENLIVSNSEGKSLELPLSTMMTMEFSNASAIKELNDTYSGPYTLFTLDGKKAGCFKTLEDAEAGVEPGTYVIKDNSNKTFKILLGK